MNTVILMAGRGSRFKDLNTDLPKPLVPLHGKPLVQWVVENIRFQTRQTFYFVCLEEHVKKYELHKLFQSWNIDFKIILVPQVTEGAACSALYAKDFINTDEELIIANSDQYIIYNKQDFLNSARENDGLIMTMNAEGTKWSYVALNADNKVNLVKEKQPISNIGTVGIYYFNKGQFFVKAAEDMIKANDRFNNEFYLAPSYNYMISDNKVIGHFNIGSVGTEMIGLGNAEDFISFRDDPRSLQIADTLFG